ncbi:16S rRNA (uracil(1498)-N(3))-methyltransferase [Salinibius halmophilus]|uniref:16S rRNA (uracil(1498)-N(3))-methyltransferase n=1 Tax=Salinibius halmophilus TaxID=1853216 RepID=UPI000E670C6B|nr:16S rRNA (uracil(1498)-N(3))-methyltransferase [Salinibius halmophilus]
MRTIRVYNPEIISSEQSFVLNEGPSHHLLRVLRLPVGSAIEVFDPAAKCYQVVIEAVQAKRAVVRVETVLDTLPPSPLHTHLGLVMSKGDRFDYAVQKATELGVNEITPLDSERCEMRLKGSRSDKKQQQWQQIAISACEQCGRSDVPIIHPPISLNDWLNIEADCKLVLHPRDAQPLTSMPTPKRVALLVGPEGGLTDTEVDSALTLGFVGTLFGPRILRTETAPVVALSLLQARWGDI